MFMLCALWSDIPTYIYTYKYVYINICSRGCNASLRIPTAHVWKTSLRHRKGDGGCFSWSITVDTPEVSWMIGRTHRATNLNAVLSSPRDLRPPGLW